MTYWISASSHLVLGRVGPVGLVGELNIGLVGLVGLVREPSLSTPTYRGAGGSSLIRDSSPLS